jgi:hypothetical protein
MVSSIWSQGLVVASSRIPEPSTPVLGFSLSAPERAWSPFWDTTIPEEKRIPMFLQWVSSYFQHRDGFLESRNGDGMEYVVPDISRVPTIFNMTATEQKCIIDKGSGSMADIVMATYLAPQFLNNFRRAIFEGNRTNLTRLRTYLVCGDSCAAFGPMTMWAVEDEDTAHGGGLINTRIIKGGNHIVSFCLPGRVLMLIGFRPPRHNGINQNKP